MKILLILVLLILDQWTKQLAVKHLKYKGLKRIGKLKLNYVENPGAAMGMFKKHPLMLKTISIFIMIVVIYLLYVEENTIRAYGFAIVIGGGLGNVLDRFRRGYVVDFFSLEIKKMPYFNMADLFVLTGCVMILITELYV